MNVGYPEHIWRRALNAEIEALARAALGAGYAAEIEPLRGSLLIGTRNPRTLMVAVRVGANGEFSGVDTYGPDNRPVHGIAGVYALLGLRGGTDTSGVPKLACEGRDIVEQLNYVASQLPGACKKREWGEAHATPLLHAVREIRRLRALLYAPEMQVPEGERPPEQFIGPQEGSDPATYFDTRY